jgi:hypothetical protein
MIGGSTSRGFDGAHRAPSNYSIAPEARDDFGPAYSMNIDSQPEDSSSPTRYRPEVQHHILPRYGAKQVPVVMRGKSIMVASQHGETPNSHVSHGETLKLTVYHDEISEQSVHERDSRKPASYKDETLKTSIYKPDTSICKPYPFAIQLHLCNRSHQFTTYHQLKKHQPPVKRLL